MFCAIFVKRQNGDIIPLMVYERQQICQGSVCPSDRILWYDKKNLLTSHADKKINYHIAYSCSEQEAVKFKEKACQILGLKDIMMAPLPASLACHIGPAARGIAVEEVIE